MADKVQRFNPKMMYKGDRPMYASAFGKYVKHADWTDAQATIETLREQIMLLHEENQRLADLLETRALIEATFIDEGEEA